MLPQSLSQQHFSSFFWAPFSASLSPPALFLLFLGHVSVTWEMFTELIYASDFKKIKNLAKLVKSSGRDGEDIPLKMRAPTQNTVFQSWPVVVGFCKEKSQEFSMYFSLNPAKICFSWEQWTSFCNRHPAEKMSAQIKVWGIKINTFKKKKKKERKKKLSNKER